MSTTHAEMVERGRQHVRNGIAELGISVPEYAILNHIHFGCHRSPKALPVFAARRDYALGQDVTLQETSRALRSCLRRGFVRVMSPADLKKIELDLAEEKILGPIYGWPNPGTIDFTDLGATLWQKIEDRQRDTQVSPLRRGFAYQDAVEIRSRWYFLSKSAANRQRSRLRKERDVASMTGLIAVEELRLAWWSPTVSGWSFDLVEQFQWQGRCSGEHSTFLNWNAEPARLDLTRFRRQCKQHKIDPSDWCVLLAIARAGGGRPQMVLRSSVVCAVNTFRLRNARDRIKQAVHRCLKGGLIVKVDSEEPLHVQAAIRSSIPPLQTLNLMADDLELSETGVSILVELGPKILGDAWIDGWFAETDIFTREHCYARDLLDVASVFERCYGRSNGKVKIGTIQELGPWCVYWWERFAEGYRVELDFIKD